MCGWTQQRNTHLPHPQHAQILSQQTVGQLTIRVWIKITHPHRRTRSRMTRRVGLRCRMVRRHLVGHFRNRLRQPVRVSCSLVGLRRRVVVRRLRSRMRMDRQQVSRCMRSGYRRRFMGWGRLPGLAPSPQSTESETRSRQIQRQAPYRCAIKQMAYQRTR
jgi:hypothetical protein